MLNGLRLIYKRFPADVARLPETRFTLPPRACYSGQFAVIKCKFSVENK